MADLLDAIKEWEGYTPRAEWDYKQNSGGYGTRARYPGETIDQAEAHRRLVEEVAKARATVTGFAPHAPDGLRDALTSLTHNAGDAWTKSGLGQAVQSGDEAQIRGRFLQYNKAGGQTLASLQARRAQELATFYPGSGSGVQAPAAAESAAAPSLTGRRPMPTDDTEQQPGLLGSLSKAIYNPLTMMGFGLLGSSSQGKGIGEGLMTGAQLGMQTQAHQAKMRKDEFDRMIEMLKIKDMQRKTGIAQGREQQWGQIGSLANVPPEVMALAKVAGPDQGPGIISAYQLKHLDAATEREKITSNKLKTDAETKKITGENDLNDWVMGLLKPPAQTGTPPAEAPPPAAGVKPMSMPQPAIDGPPGLMNATAPQQAESAPSAGDPNLILAQAATPQQAPTPPASAERMVTLPGGRQVPESQAKALAFGLAMKGKGDAGNMVLSNDALGKDGANEVDKQLVARMSDINELDNIKRQFNPKFLGLEGAAKSTALGWQDWVSSGSVSPENKAYLRDYTRFSSATSERMNNRIKAMAGTAVSGAEEKRMYTANPSTHDSPNQFEAKLNEQITMQKMALARYNWLKNRGVPHAQISELAKTGRIEGMAGLEDMRDIYAKRADEVVQEIQKTNPQLPADRIKDMTRMRLKREFGI